MSGMGEKMREVITGMSDLITDVGRISDDARIAALRASVVNTKDNEGVSRLRDMCVVDARSLRASEAEPSWVVRRGLLTRDRLSSIRFEIDDLELLVGRLSSAETDAGERAAARAFVAPYDLDLPGQTGHCELDMGPMMQLGLDGLAADIRDRRVAAGDGETRSTYRAFLYALDGLSAMIEQAAATVDAALRDAAGMRRAELQELSAACHHIAHGTPRSFLEAVQLLWFALVGVMNADKASLVVPGHLDRTLWPFYQADIAREVLTRERALMLIEHLYIAINAYIPDGLAMSVMVGGRDAAGDDVTNELSYLCLEALRRTKMIYPAVGVCWHEATPEPLVDLAVELMGHGYPTPAFFSDTTIQRGLRALDVPDDEACRYINSTCVEITPGGASNVWVASPYYNTCGLLLEEIAMQAEIERLAQAEIERLAQAETERLAQAETEKLAGGHSDGPVAQAYVDGPAPTFEQFVVQYRDRLAGAISDGVAAQNRWRRERYAHMRRPLQSVFTRDCVSQGLDIEAGGATYNWIECSFIGLANLADALYVIREEVYGQRRLSFAQLKGILDADFAGLEATRQRFLNGYPKYGQGNAEVDALLAEIVGFVAETCAGFAVEPDGSAYVPGAFAWVMHERLGRETGATPDGRRAGFPFADGCGPAQGRESCGPTAAVLSVTGWDHSRMLGGLAYNLKFNSSLFRSEEGFEGLKALILTYLRRGGFEVQVNVVDGETLKAARVDPEAYRDLIVRIGGYADYFTRLSPEMQDELILRTEFEQF